MTPAPPTPFALITTPLVITGNGAATRRNPASGTPILSLLRVFAPATSPSAISPSPSPARPLVSTLNTFDGSVVSNAAILSVFNGYVSIYATDTTQLILDLTGYFAP